MRTICPLPPTRSAGLLYHHIHPVRTADIPDQHSAWEVHPHIERGRMAEENTALKSQIYLAIHSH